MKLTPRLVGIIWLVIGIALIAMAGNAGWAFVVMGAIWLIRSGKELQEQNPGTYQKVTLAGVILAILALLATLVIRISQP